MLKEGPLRTGGTAFVVVSFALNSVITRWIVGEGRLDAGVTTGVRFVAGAAILVAVAGARGRIGQVLPTRTCWTPVFWLAAYAFLISYGYRFIGAAAGTFVFYAAVLATMTFGGALRERQAPAAGAVVGGLIALAGVGVLASGDLADVTLLGVLLLAGTGVSWGAYSLLGRDSSTPLRTTTATFVAFAILLLPAGGVALAVTADTIAWSWPGIVAAILMGAVTTALSYAVWYWVLSRITSGQAGTYQLAIPVLAAALGVLWLGEAASLRLAASGALVVGGMAVAARWR